MQRRVRRPLCKTKISSLCSALEIGRGFDIDSRIFGQLVDRSSRTGVEVGCGWAEAMGERMLVERSKLSLDAKSRLQVQEQGSVR